MDEITKMRYENILSTTVQGNPKNPLIKKWKGTTYVPPSTHEALKWSTKDLLSLMSPVTDAPW